MQQNNLVDRLAGLPSLSGVPRAELEWLAAHGTLEICETGDLIAPKEERLTKLWILLSGHIAIRVDKGTGSRIAMEWRTGDVGGILPYSRMKAPPGVSTTLERSDVFTLFEEHFPEMVHHCPVFTTLTVHIMLDRARSFNTSDQQDEKMISLGKLAAGLAHELNNPASATVRGAKLLLVGLEEADAASRALGASGLTPVQAEAIEKARGVCIGKRSGNVLSPLEQADREDAFAEWLTRHRIDDRHAAPLAGTDLDLAALDGLAKTVPGPTLGIALRWISAGCSTRSLAVDIERAANRIYELVATVKKFTYMDNLAGRESVDVEAGILDTMRILASKARSRGASITLEVEPGLPRATANGGELNQVWLNLIDNALDAIPDSGKIAVNARWEMERIVVRIVDNGPGIPADVLSRIFDPFFTTKPPGQGTGLGLDIARRILRRYFGDIEIQSKPGRTECRVRLVAEKPAARVKDAPVEAG